MASRVFADGVLDGKVAIVTGGGTGLGKAAAAELIACGASVVGSAEIAAFNWFASRQSGTLAATRHTGLFEDALRAEMRAWDSGDRDPAAISSAWGPELRTSGVALRLLQLADEIPLSHAGEVPRK